MTATPPTAAPAGRVVVAWSVIAVLVLLAFLATVGSLLRDVYSASGFVRHYLDAVATGDARGALEIPGVALLTGDADPASGVPVSSLLRRSTMAPLDRVEIVSERTSGDVVEVVASYTIGGSEGTSTFQVQREGTIWLLLPTWRFAESPLSPVTVEVRHGTTFTVGDLTLDNRAMLPAGETAGFDSSGTYLAFTPGSYTFAHETPLTAAQPVGLQVTDPGAPVSVSLDVAATADFVAKVQAEVDGYLDECATQQVLQPTGCPFGEFITDRIQTPPVWSIVDRPVVTVVPGDDSWLMPETPGVAHLVVEVRSLFDGTVDTLDQDEPFSLALSIRINEDGGLAIQVL